MSKSSASGVRVPGPTQVLPPKSCVAQAGYLSSMNVLPDLYKGGCGVLHLLGLL